MKFWEAMKAYDEGEKVRCKRWASSLFIEKEYWDVQHLDEADVNGYWELQEKSERFFVPMADACPSCLGRMEVVLGIEKREIKRIGNRVWVQFKCPECSYNWACMFLTDKK